MLTRLVFLVGTDQLVFWWGIGGGGKGQFFSNS